LVLLKAWELLYEEGYNFELHLTIPETDTGLIKLISILNSKGLKIQNHGIIAQSELVHLYQLSEYLVYPSLNESFGLPLMEAIQQNCKVIAADLPYSKETIKPTALFNPHQPSSLKNAILEAILQKNNGTKSEIITENKIDSLIELLNN
jgi:glycosyltransferase involved in cell wall biosynthesis